MDLLACMEGGACLRVFREEWGVSGAVLVTVPERSERDARWRKQRKKERNYWNLIYLKNRKSLGKKSLHKDTNVLPSLQ